MRTGGKGMGPAGECGTRCGYSKRLSFGGWGGRERSWPAPPQGLSGRSRQACRTRALPPADPPARPLTLIHSPCAPTHAHTTTLGPTYRPRQYFHLPTTETPTSLNPPFPT